MKKTLIFTVAAAVIMGISPLHAEIGSVSLPPVQKQMIEQSEGAFGTAPTSPQDEDVELISGCVIVVGAENWKNNVQDLYEFIGVTPRAEWEEFETEGQLYYNKKEYSGDGKNRYDVIVIPYSDRYAGVMIRVFGVKSSPDHEDFVVPDISGKTMAGICAFMMFPRDDREQWESEFWDACGVLGIDVMESEWEEHETEYSPTYSKTGFDEKGEHFFEIYMVPPIEEGDLCAVTIIKWALEK